MATELEIITPDRFEKVASCFVGECLASALIGGRPITRVYQDMFQFQNDTDAMDFTKVLDSKFAEVKNINPAYDFRMLIIQTMDNGLDIFASRSTKALQKIYLNAKKELDILSEIKR